MRIALIRPGEESAPGPRELLALTAGLRERGHAAVMVDAPRARLREALRGPESLLRRRGFTGPLTHVPAVVASLLSGRFEVAHAFSAPDALAARLWRVRTGRAMVFTCLETLDRASVAQARLRLRLLSAALHESDSVLAADADSAAALRRWMAIDAQILPVSDTEGALRIYRTLNTGGGGRR